MDNTGEVTLLHEYTYTNMMEYNYTGLCYLDYDMLYDGSSLLQLIWYDNRSTSVAISISNIDRDKANHVGIYTPSRVNVTMIYNRVIRTILISAS